MFGFGSRRRFAGFRHGQYVTVRSLGEILATLDADGKFEGLPFMPEMAPLCGKRFRVYRRAERTCVEGVGMRGLTGTVLLDGLRCDGSAHAGCQRGCLFFWKEVWLKPADPSNNAPQPQSPATNAPRLPTTRGDRFFCQSTELAGATTDSSPGRLESYWRDWRVGELRPWQFARFLGTAAASRLWRLLSGRALHQITGQQKTTLTEELNLQPGEVVEVKSAAEIAATLDTQGRNRGLTFEREMALHCGRRYRVATPVRTIIAEESGKMVRLGNTVILEGLTCQGLCTRNCPRANHFYWREIWLRRI